MKIRLSTKYKITLKSHKNSVFMSLILHNDLSYISSKINSQSKLEIVIKGCDRHKYIDILKKSDFEYEIEELPSIWKPLCTIKHRIGIIIGIIILIFALNYSSNIVWQINVEGNKNITDGEVIEELRAAGFDLGTFIPSIDYDNLHNKVLLNSQKLSWISVNITGNVANVKVKEYKKAEEKTSPLYTNIVASSDGYVVDVSVLNGKKVVSVGDVVKKGDILIGGIINSQSQGTRLEMAQGSVKAYVNKEINIKIHFSYEKKVYNEEKYVNKIYKIYNFPIKFSSKYGNQSAFYDTIEKKEQLCLFGISKLPIEITKTTYYGYLLIPVKLSVDEAQELASLRLREQLDVFLLDAELVSKSINTYYDEEYFYLNCSMYCLEDIAQVQEYFVIE